MIKINPHNTFAKKSSMTTRLEFLDDISIVLIYIYVYIFFYDVSSLQYDVT